jgi:xanthosine utilization system XapX-like protein
MVAQAPDGRAGRLAGAAGFALLLAGLTLLLEPASRRAAAAVLLAAGLAVGVVVALRLPAAARLRTPMERLNDAAFLVVVSAVALIAVRLARPWTAALPGLVGGVLIGWSLRPRPGRPPTPQGHADTAPSEAGTPPHQAGTPPHQADSPPGQAGTSPPGAEAPESGG